MGKNCNHLGVIILQILMVAEQDIERMPLSNLMNSHMSRKRYKGMVQNQNQFEPTLPFLAWII